MFKVICITNNPAPECCDLVVGNIYTVTKVRQAVGAKKGVMVYEILEGIWSGYWTGYFSPFSDIDETEFIREYKKELV